MAKPVSEDEEEEEEEAAAACVPPPKAANKPKAGCMSFGCSAATAWINAHCSSMLQCLRELRSAVAL